jgi:hypothetical protein
MPNMAEIAAIDSDARAISKYDFTSDDALNATLDDFRTQFQRGL